jgi:hypothetical protein
VLSKVVRHDSFTNRRGLKKHMPGWKNQPGKFSLLDRSSFSRCVRRARRMV